MNDEHPDLDPSLDPALDERVRSLLSEAGSQREPLPPDVAARLDDTLAGLVAEREAGRLSEEHTATGTVVPLRPRWMPRIAAAAAAVIVLGLGGLTVANLGHVSSDDSGGSADSARSATSPDAGGGTALQEDAPSPSSPAGGRVAEDNADKSADLPRLRTALFKQDVSNLLSDLDALRASGEAGGEATNREPGSAKSRYATSCPGPKVTDGSIRTAVLLDSRGAALVVHPARDGKRLVEAWSCDGRRRLASTTVAP